MVVEEGEKNKSNIPVPPEHKAGMLVWYVDIIIKNQWWVEITRTGAPVWASKILVEKAVLDRLLAPLDTIPLDWGKCGLLFCVYGIYDGVAGYSSRG